MSEKAPLFAVIRIRGIPDRHPDERKTLELLRLHKKFHAVLVRATPSIRKMLQKVEFVVTYGEINKETLALLLERRGRLTGNKRLTLDYLKKLGYNSFEELAEAILEQKVTLDKIPGLKPVFRLTPPSGGFKGTIKKHFRDGGELGYRGEAINDLLKRMI